MFNCFLSIFVSVQVSDAYVNILSIIVFFSLNFSFFDMFFLYHTLTQILCLLIHTKTQAKHYFINTQTQKPNVFLHKQKPKSNIFDYTHKQKRNTLANLRIW